MPNSYQIRQRLAAERLRQQNSEEAWELRPFFGLPRSPKEDPVVGDVLSSENMYVAVIGFFGFGVIFVCPYGCHYWDLASWRNLVKHWKVVNYG